MANRFSDRILSYMASPRYRPVKLRRLARQMGIAEEEYGEFREAVDALRRVGRVLLGGGNALTLPEASRRIVGVYRANPRGFGFVVPSEPGAHGDLFIPPRESLDAITGDTVECEVRNRAGRDGASLMSGRIIRVVQRGNNELVGELCHEAGRWFVIPDGNRVHAPIFVSDVGAKAAKAGDQVVVEIVTYPAEGRQARGVIVERLGRRGGGGVDVRSIIRQHQLPEEFPAEALADAREAVKRFDPDRAGGDREDLRDEVIVTIDPDDARDFDDAISLRRLDSERDGGRGRGAARRGRGRGAGGEAAWELGVHIADVSAFVRPGTTLDEEARQRGNSVYFPRRVIPMLPEVLSNGVCSLQEDEPRLCKSAFVRYDAEGRVLSARFANTIIRSTRRLTYRQATGILEGRTGGYPREVVELVRRMDELARIIQKRRLAQGQIVLDLPEIELVLDDNDRVIDAMPADTSFSHTIIEMFMVEANEAVARLLAREGVPFLRRIHPSPDEESTEALGRFLKVAGHEVPRRLERSDLQRLLVTIRGRPEAFAVNLAVLKSLEQAVYSPKAEGHYALASECYTHFTSPIRRYTDLTIHRLLGELIEAGRAGAVAGEHRGRRRHGGGDAEQDLEALGRHLSFTERRAADAERELKTLKILELLAQHIGERFDGVVTGVANFGLFVQHPRFLIDGLIELREMPDDYWIVDTRGGCVVGERTRRRLAIGDVITVEIAGVDLAARRLELRYLSGARPGRARAEGQRKGGRGDGGGGRRRGDARRRGGRWTR